MTPTERQAKLDEIVVRFAIVGFLKDGGKLDGCLCISDIDFKKEYEKFEIAKVYRLTEIHKR